MKAVLLLGGTVVLTVLLYCASTATSTGCATAAERSDGKAFLAPGLKYGGDWTARLDSSAWDSARPCWARPGCHILSRFYTVPTARAAHHSVV